MSTVIKLPVIHRRIPTPLSRFMGREKRVEKVERGVYMAMGLAIFGGIFVTAHHDLSGRIASGQCCKPAEVDIEQVRIHNLNGRAEAGTNSVTPKLSPVG